MSQITNISEWPRLEPHRQIDTSGWKTYEVQTDHHQNGGYLIAVHPFQVENWDRDIVDSGLAPPPESTYVFTVSVVAVSEEDARDWLVDHPSVVAEAAELETVL